MPGPYRPCALWRVLSPPDDGGTFPLLERGLERGAALPLGCWYGGSCGFRCRLEDEGLERKTMPDLNREGRDACLLSAMHAISGTILGLILTIGRGRKTRSRLRNGLNAGSVGGVKNGWNRGAGNRGRPLPAPTPAPAPAPGWGWSGGGWSPTGGMGCMGGKGKNGGETYVGTGLGSGLGERFAKRSVASFWSYSSRRSASNSVS
jgi:hypothetical protein